MLNSVLELTSSQHGFIGQVTLIEQPKLLINMHATSNNVWDSTGQMFIADSATVELEFTPFNSLITDVLENRQFVASHVEASEVQQTPNHFAVFPLFNSKQFAGIVAVARAQGEYSHQLFEKIQPFLNTCAQLIQMDIN